MSSYLIYGKIVKPVKINGKEVQPQKNFKALTYGGVRAEKLSDADDYADRSDAEEKLQKVHERLIELGIDDCIEFQIRKAK